MNSPRTRSYCQCILILIFTVFGFSIAYSQETQNTKELTEAINNAKNANYAQAIPVLKKYADAKGFDDFTILQINVYLNFCYLATKNEALNVAKVNAHIDAYLKKYGISKTDSLRSLEEMKLLFIAGMINGNVGNNEKMVFYLTLIKKHYDEKHLIGDQFFSNILYQLAIGYYNLSDNISSIEIGQIALKVNNELLGEMNEASLKILGLLYSSYYRNNETVKSLVYLQKRIMILKEFLGEDHPDYLESLANLAVAYLKLGSYSKALEINLKVIELGKEVWGEKQPDYLTSLNNLAVIYSDLGNYQKALEIDIKVTEFRKEILGEKHPDYLISLSNLASVYSDLGDYQKALEIKLKVIDLVKEVLGEKHPDYLKCLSNLASAYSDLGDYQKSLEINLKVVELRKEILGEKHPDYLTSLSNLAVVYSDLGDYKKTLEIDFKVVELRKEILGEKHPDYLLSLANLSQSYSALGDYQKALEINLKVVEMQKEILGEKHPDYLTSLSNLAANYSDLGDYQKALEINLKVVELRKEILGEKHPDYLLSLANLSQSYSALGDYKKALEINLKVVELRKEVLSEKHPEYLGSLNNLATNYKYLRDYTKSMEINLQVVDLSKEVLGEKHPHYLTSLNNLASAYSDLGDYQKALEINLKVVDLRKEILGEKHPDYLTSLNNMALVYSDLGDYKKSLEIDLKVVELRKEVFGDEHPEYLKSLINLAVTEFHMSETNSALGHYFQMLNKSQERVIEYFSLMTEHHRELFWKQFSRYFTLFPMFFEKAALSYPNGANDAYNFSLFSKGLLLNTTLDFDKLIAEKGNPEVIAKFEELKLLKLEIQRLLEKPIAKRYLNVDSLENIAQQKETELVKLSKEYGDYTSNMKINWKDIQAKLEEKDVAIEFVEYPTLTDTVKYAALVLRKGWQYPKMISLFRKDQINEFIKQDKDKIYSNGFVGKQIKKLIWSPLEELIAPGERVYFSAAGIIHQLAIENLVFDDTQILGDVYRMYRLSSTKELAIRQPEDKNTTVVLYGGLKYDLEVKEMVAESKKYEKKENLYAMRGYQNDTTVRNGWKFLDGTKPEVDQINNLMKEKHYQVTEYTGETGNEESFKSLSGKKEGIIHIATHGFFQSVEESRKNLFMMQRMGDQQQERATFDPMLRSGLIMAGGNKAWLGEKIPENIEDGVLTAKEISRMDLRGTDLVVLSACETGLGDVSSEGVFGLQRSFKQAGVKTLVMSLWEVSDKATSYIMTEFYSNLLSGKEKRVAFLEAKQKCKAKFPEPQYWAAFIMLD